VGKVWRGLVGALGLAVAATVGVGRVYLGYHTTSQVLAGALIGALCAVAWFALVERILRPLFPALAATTLARQLWIRDLTPVKNVLKVEWEACMGYSSKSTTLLFGERKRFSQYQNDGLGFLLPHAHSR